LIACSRSARTGDDIREIRNILDTSLSNVARDPNLDSILLEQEVRKLDESIIGGNRTENSWLFICRIMHVNVNAALVVVIVTS